MSLTPDSPGFVGKIQELYRYFPKPAYNLVSGSGQGISVLLDVIGGELNTTVDDWQDARDQFFLATAVGSYIDVIGVNVNVPRPTGFDDAFYTQLVEIITYSSKNIEKIFERILELFFGDNSLPMANVLITGNSISGNNEITNLSSTYGISVGFPLTGPGIPSGTYVTAVNTVAMTVTLSQNVTTTATGSTFNFSVNQQFSWIANAYSIIPNQIVLVISQSALIQITQRDLFGSWFIHPGLTDLTYTGNATENSDTLTDMSSTSGISAGMFVSGAGIPQGTTVLSAGGSTVTLSDEATLTSEDVYFNFDTGLQDILSTTGNFTAGSNQLTSLASTSGLQVGQTITASEIPSGTFISEISGSTVTMTNEATTNGTGASVVFSWSPDNYYSGFIYDNIFPTVVEESVVSGDTSTIPLNPSTFNTYGVAYIGAEGGPTFETGAYTVIDDVLYFDSPLHFNHLSGEVLTRASIGTDIFTQLTSAISVVDVTAKLTSGSAVVTVVSSAGISNGMLVSGNGFIPGTTVTGTTGTTITLSNPATLTNSYVPLTFSTASSTLSVNDGSNFPPPPAAVSWPTFAIRIDRGTDSEEIVPLIGVSPAGDTTLLIDPGYAFRFSHSIGARVQLMSLQTQVSTDGTDYPIYFTDTASFETTLLSILQRVKSVGMELVVSNGPVNVDTEDNFLTTESGEILTTETGEDILV